MNNAPQRTKGRGINKQRGPSDLKYTVHITKKMKNTIGLGNMFEYLCHVL